MRTLQNFTSAEIRDLLYEATPVSDQISIVTSNGSVTCFLRNDPFFRFEENNINSRRWIIGHCAFYKYATQKQIAVGFQVHRNTVSNSLKEYLEHDGNLQAYKVRKKKWTGIDEETCRKLGETLAQGASLRSAAKTHKVIYETVRRYQIAGRIPQPSKPNETVESQAATSPDSNDLAGLEKAPDRTARDQSDSHAAMGMGAHDVKGRVAASLPAQEGPKPHFTAARAVKNAGVLIALPALLETGLLRHINQLPECKGYYRQTSFLLFLAFLYLARVCSAEQTRFQIPGEWGKIIGGDRCPEVTTIRRRVRQLATVESMNAWRSALAKDWLRQDPKDTATLYLDGHVKVYTGREGNLPKHFVSRQKLCLPAAVSYWLHSLGGTPFLCIPKQIDSKMVKTLQKDILPQLRDLGLLPANPSDSEPSLEAQPALTLVFDRDGWSPELFAKLARQGVAGITWRKGPIDDWPEEEFVMMEVPVPGPCGSINRSIPLAENKVELTGADIEMREIRCLRSDGRQSSIITTHKQMDIKQVAGTIFSRWSQENFFLYARREFHLDHLPVHELEEVDSSEIIVNPIWREAKNTITKIKNKLGNLKLRIQAKIKRKHKVQKLQEKESVLTNQLEELMETKKQQPSHIKAGELPSSEQLQALPQPVRQFYDLIRMIVYRSETALMPFVWTQRKVRPNPRAILKAVFQTDADILPNEAEGKLIIRLMHQSNKTHNQALEELIKVLNKKKIKFPETNLTLVYKLAD